MLPSDLMEQEGWIQGSYSDGGLCALGAVNKAFTGYAIEAEAKNHPTWSRVVEFFGRDAQRVDWVTWNDRPERTQEDVVAALRQREIELGFREQMTMEDLIAPMKEKVSVK